MQRAFDDFPSAAAGSPNEAPSALPTGLRRFRGDAAEFRRKPLRKKPFVGGKLPHAVGP
jgi:hypothetical protein